jgi:hypothetical protein
VTLFWISHTAVLGLVREVFLAMLQLCGMRFLVPFEMLALWKVLEARYGLICSHWHDDVMILYTFACSLCSATEHLPRLLRGTYHPQVQKHNIDTIYR